VAVKFIIIIIIIIIIIGKYTISFMQGIYTYIPETNHVPKECNVAAILSLLFMVPISLAPIIVVVVVVVIRMKSVCCPVKKRGRPEGGGREVSSAVNIINRRSQCRSCSLDCY
jgi:hypothetical protein